MSSIPQAQCRLLNLPSEIRNEIYELAFTDIVKRDSSSDVAGSKGVGTDVKVANVKDFNRDDLNEAGTNEEATDEDAFEDDETDEDDTDEDDADEDDTSEDDTDEDDTDEDEDESDEDESDVDKRDKDFRGRINLLDHQPPSDALLRTCGQIRQEASGLYHEAQRGFASQDFYLDLRDKNLVYKREIESLNECMLKAITHLHVRSYDLDDGCNCECDYDWQSGVWKRFERHSPNNSPDWMFFYDFPYPGVIDLKEFKTEAQARKGLANVAAATVSLKAQIMEMFRWRA